VQALSCGGHVVTINQMSMLVNSVRKLLGSKTAFPIVFSRNSCCMRDLEPLLRQPPTGAPQSSSSAWLCRGTRDLLRAGGDQEECPGAVRT
jgi:hypothetical protein